LSTTLDIDELLSSPTPVTTVTGQVTEATSDIALVRLPDGRTVHMPVSEFYPNRTWSVGGRYVLALTEGERPTLSASHPDLIALLLAGLSPEIRDGRVRVMAVARQVGIRSKVAVAATDPGIDPVGACLGKGANRVRTLSSLLLGERVDVVSYHPDKAIFAVNALAVRPLSALLDDTGQVSIAVPAHQLEAARGGGGLNIALASRLVGARINVIGE
jgi:transcription termination/antitermination protein NusA